MNSGNLVVLGGGFGGLAAAKTLAKKSRGRFRVVLIDRNPVQIFTPTLPELEIDEIDLKAIAKKFGFELQTNEILGLDVKNKIVRLADKTLAADGLILALGAETEYFGIPGLPENSLIFKSGWDVKKILDRLSNQGKPRIVIAGGGPTGTELAGFLASKAKVTIVEKSGSILPAFSEKFRTLVKNRLLKNGVEIIYNCGILEAKSDSVTLENIGEQKCDLLIWAGGNRGPKAYRDSGLELDGRGRALVSKDLKAVPGIFAIGDAAALREGRLAGGARSAIMQGQTAAKNLISDLAGKSGSRYPNWNYPYLLPLNHFWAAMELGSLIFSGWLIYLFKKLINWQYLKIGVWQ